MTAPRTAPSAHLAPEPLADRELNALIDRLILEQGRLDPLELLLAADLLTYADYEAWRTGARPDLQGCLRGDPLSVADLLGRAGAYARGQKLAPEPPDPEGHRAWGGGTRTLVVGDHPELARACATAYGRPAERRQLDLFQDSGGLLLEDDLRRALAERRTDSARGLAARLMRHDPRHPRLRDYLRLIQAADDLGPPGPDTAPPASRQPPPGEGRAPSGGGPVVEPETRAPAGTPLPPETRTAELDALTPLAERLLGHRARDFLSPLWAALAESLAGRPFDPAAPRLHAAHAWARAGRPERARAAVESAPDWRAHAPLVLAHSDACRQTRDLAAARRDWLLLAWEHPTEAETALSDPALPDRRLAELWNSFRDLDDDLETESFPAWLLIRDPATAAAVPPELAPPDERGEPYRLLHRLASGEDSVALRRTLADIRPDLLKLWLARRG